MNGLFVPNALLRGEVTTVFQGVCLSYLHTLQKGNGRCDISNKELANFMNCSVIRITNTLGELEKNGFLTLTTQKKGLPCVVREIQLTPKSLELF